MADTDWMKLNVKRKPTKPTRWLLLSFLAGSLVVGFSMATPTWGQDTPTQSAPAKSSDEPKDDDPSMAKTSDNEGESVAPPGDHRIESGATTGDGAGATTAEDAISERVGLDALSAAQLEPLREPKDPTSYGRWVLLPALLTIILAILTRQVVPALVVGVTIASYMLLPCLADANTYAQSGKLVGGFRLAAEHYVLGAIADDNHIKIMVFTLVIGFMVGVIGRNGGTRGMVRLVAGKSSSPRRCALTAWLAGLFVFFDDYANSMIVGPTMQPVFDRVKLSRAKLAYIVDSTAAPVASLALIGTWVGAEIGYIQDGLDAVAAKGAALLDSQGNVITGMQAFLGSIPYRFYPILALFLVFLIALTGRDFGPMKRSERKILSKIDPDPSAESSETASKRATATWWLGLAPVFLLVVSTIWVLVATGLSAEGTATAMSAVAPDGSSTWAAHSWWERAGTVVSNADSYIAIFYGAVFSAIAAVLLTMISRVCSVRDAVDAGLEGMSRMFPAVVILILAWSLSAVLQDLKLGEVAVTQLRSLDFQAMWLPLAVFICAAIVSFATGTSWGTMGILCPLTVMIAVELAVELEPARALGIFYASVGSVLAGAVFGDHCSPISDTTVLSSIASGCRHEEHVWTQIPYALVAAIAAMGLGDVACSVYGQPWYYGLGAGALFLLLVVFVLGRRPVPSFELADAGP
jgi:Na+/H+ antiporter NhaC